MKSNYLIAFVLLTAFVICISVYSILKSPIKYQSEQYGFELELPHSFEGFYVLQENNSDGSHDLLFIYDVHDTEWVDGKFDVFRVLVIPTNVFNSKYESNESKEVYSIGFVEEEPSLGQELGRTENNVFLGTRGHDCPISKCELYEQAFDVLNTFKLIE